MPRYIVGANGQVQPIGNALAVEGPKSKTTYGDGKSHNSAGSGLAHTQYGNIVISGKGYGHGVGMSQSGARGMADAGYTYDEIIKHYFQGVELQR